MERVKISVAMATYNGEKYIKEQIDSILLNLLEGDEIIISDDGSTDSTIDILKSYNDKRIHIVDGPREGVKKNFENAIKNTTGEYIFLADQDDIWEKNKVKKILEVFENYSNCTLVIHDASVFDNDTKKIIIDSFFDFRKSRSGVCYNILKNSYIGCCMVFSKKIKPYLDSIPENVEMHDQWIGIMNDLYFSKSYFLKEKLLKYRRHLNNVTGLKHYSFYKMLKNRIILVKEIIKRIIK